MTTATPAQPPYQVPPLVLSEISEGVETLTLNDPEGLNVLTWAMLKALRQRLQAGRENPAVRVIVLTGNGRAFSAGHDLKEMAGRSREEVDDLLGLCTEVMEGIRLHPKPVIARVQGIAAAAGCQLVASCDLAVASDRARFGTTGIKAGLFCCTPMVPLSRVVPDKKAMEMLLTGDLISAEEAEKAGLVNRVAPHAELEEATRNLAARIASMSPYAIQLGKEAYYRQRVLDMDEAYRVGQEAMAANTLAPDGQEGIAAFLEKRPPNFEP